jgi:response regulator of citrate/malate metabolism
MELLRVLIVEDEALVAIDLQLVVARFITADIWHAPTLACARDALEQPIDFAFLDVDVTDGKTFDIASELLNRKIPFAFVSATRRDMIPLCLRDRPFISKPYRAEQIQNALKAIKPRAA